MTGPGLRAALERADTAIGSAQARELIDLGLARIHAGAEDVLEVTGAFWQTETHGGDGVAILTREALCVVLAPIATGLLRRRSAPACVAIPLTHVRDLIDDDAEFGGAVVFFAGSDGHADFILRFERTAERDRFYRCVLAAHRGDFSRWGLQLDPANYVADFDRFYAELLATGIEDAIDLLTWAEQRYGDFRIDSALGLAREWRGRELNDQKRPDGVSMRAALIGMPTIWGEVPEARRVLLRLGEQLFDAGLLRPPYDERSWGSDEPLRAMDVGPARLLAVMTLAGYASELRDPRAQEFASAALPHLSAVPAGVFPEALRRLWSDIAPLPVAGEPRELDIWADPDVSEACRLEDGQVRYDGSALTDSDAAAVSALLTAALRIRDGDAASCIAAALAGVTACEELSPLCPRGWRKLAVYQVSEAAHQLWGRFSLAHEAAMLAQWVTVTIEANGWGPDGNSTPLGQHHSYCMNLAGRTGVGILAIDAVTGMASAPTGDEARRAARVGSF